MTDTIETTFSV